MRGTVERFVARTDGQDLAEYGVLAALIALVAFGAIRTVGTQIDTVFWHVIASSV